METTHTKVLVVWPGSYIGRRLTRKLLEQDTIRLRLLLPDARRLSEFGIPSPSEATNPRPLSLTLRWITLSSAVNRVMNFVAEEWRLMFTRHSL